MFTLLFEKNSIHQLAFQTHCAKWIKFCAEKHQSTCETFFGNDCAWACIFLNCFKRVWLNLECFQQSLKWCWLSGAELLLAIDD